MKPKHASIVWALWILNCMLLFSQANDDIAQRARKLHFSSLVLDTHVDTTSKLETAWRFTDEHKDGHLDLPRMLTGGLNALFFSIWIPGETKGPLAVNNALLRIAAVHKLAEDFPDRIALCVTAEPIIRELAAEYEAKGRMAELRQEVIRRCGPAPKISWERIIDHIDHAVKLVGSEHVGLGSDFDGAEMPEGLENVSKLPKITEALIRRGYKESDIKNILGENMLRILDAVERTSQSMKNPNATSETAK